MGLRFRKTIGILPGLRMNIGKSGASFSEGGHGLTVNTGARGTKLTAGLPGTGLSYSTKTYGKGGNPWLRLLFMALALGMAAFRYLSHK